MKAFTIVVLSLSCSVAIASEATNFPRLAARAEAGEPAALRDILAASDGTPPGDQLEALAELSSRYVASAPVVFLEAQAARPGCFGVGFLGERFTDDDAARAQERAARRQALQSVTDTKLASVKARCLAQLAGD
jgi:hypothetical protein